MNFLFVDTNPERTGATTHFIALARAMVEAGHEVSAVVCPGGMIHEQLQNSPVQLYPTTFRNAFDLRGYATVWRVARKCRANWLVGNSGKEYWPLMVIGRLLRVPVALFRHRATGMKRMSAYLVSHCAQRLIAASAHARQAYLERGIPARMVRVLGSPPFAINTPRFIISCACCKRHGCDSNVTELFSRVICIVLGSISALTPSH